MLGKLKNHARQIGIGVAVSVQCFGGFADDVLANELPNDAFASLAPRPIKGTPSRDYNGLPIGAWLVYPSVSAGVVYDSNIFQTSTNRVSALGARVVPTFNAIRDDGIHKSTLYGTADARFYAQHGEADWITARAGLTHDYEVMRDLVVRFQGDYTRQTDLFNGAANFNNNIGAANPFGIPPVTNPFPNNQLIGSASVTKMFNESFVSVRGAIAHIAYDGSTGLAGSTAVAPPAGTIYSVTTRAGYWISPFFYAYVEPTLDWRRYDAGAGDSNGYRTVAGIATDRIGLYRGEIFAGYQSQRSEQVISGNPSWSGHGTVFGARVTYEPTRFLAIRAVVDETLGVSQVNDPTVPAGTLTRLLSALLQADYTMARDWTLSGRYGYINTSYLSDFGGSRHDDGWLAGLKYSYTSSANLGIAVEYQYIVLNPNGLNAGFTRNVITLSGTYRY